MSSGSRSLREAKQVSEAAGLDVGPGVGPAARGMAPLVALACGDEGGAGGVAVEDPGDVLRLSGEALPVVGEVDLQRVEGEVRVGQVSSCSGTCPGWTCACSAMSATGCSTVTSALLRGSSLAIMPAREVPAVSARFVAFRCCCPAGQCRALFAPFFSSRRRRFASRVRCSPDGEASSSTAAARRLA